MHRLLLLSLAIAAAAFNVPATTAQSAPPPTSAQAIPAEAPPTVDPLLVKPADQVTPDQVATLQKRLNDWAGLNVFHDQNLRLAPAGGNRVVFFGDSITIAWSTRDNNVFFPGKPYVNRGISGQTTPQMLVRFQQDVVALKPAMVVILAGINDIAGNAGVETLPMIEDNFRSMVAIAQANHIRVVLSSTLPAKVMAWRPGTNPAAAVKELNAWLASFAAANHCTWLDYYSAMADADGGMKPGLSKDGVHPTPAGYAVMAPLAQAAIDRAMRTR